MAATIYYDNDADLSVLKDMTIAVLGYGSQGHAHAQNLRDSGCKVVVGQRKGSANYDLAVEHGFQPTSLEDAVKQADLIVLTLPDELQGKIFANQIRPNLKENAIILTTHGFNVHYGQFDLPAGNRAIMIAPKGPGHLVRSEFVKGGGVPCLIALDDKCGDYEKSVGLAYAKGIGGTRGGGIQTTFKEETETDLFGEKIPVGMESERIPYDEIGQYWNSKMKGKTNPQIRQIDESRKTAIRQRWSEFKNEVYTAIDKVSESEFLTSRKSFGFDWCFEKKHMTKILEGNYDNKKEEAVRRHKDYSDIKDEDLEKEFHWT